MMLFDTDNITLTRQFVPISTLTPKLTYMQGVFFLTRVNLLKTGNCLETSLPHVITKVPNKR